MSATTYEEALADVKARVNASRTSFHAGMAMLPKTRREAMYAFYAFCREVDDIADEGADVDIRSKGLEIWHQKISDLFKGQTTDTITAALLPAIKSFSLYERDFQDVIDGMAMDAGVLPMNAPDLATLDLYCDRVASAVGRVSVRIFGDASESAMRLSYHLGRAFQLTNILRDIAEDASRKRLYLPEELLEKHAISSRDPNLVLNDPALPAVCRDLALTAAEHFQAADQAMRQCDKTAMRPARIMRAYYGAIFDRLTALDWHEPKQRVRLPTWQKFWLALRAAVG